MHYIANIHLAELHIYFIVLYLREAFLNHNARTYPPRRGRLRPLSIRSISNSRLCIRRSVRPGRSFASDIHHSIPSVVLHTIRSRLCRYATHVHFLPKLRTLTSVIGEVGGYYGRAWSHQDIRNGSPYLIQLMLILVSAPLLAATVYMTLGRLTRALNAEEHAVISTRWVTKIYVLIDIASFVCQIFGSAVQASGDAKGIEMGRKVVMGGLGAQLFAFFFFFVMTATLHRRLNNEPTSVSVRFELHWRRHFWVLYAVSGLIFVRSLYRLIEFASGTDSALMKTEALLYVFDASLMFLVVLLFAVVHPGQLFKAVRTVGKTGGRDETSFVLLEQGR